MHFISGNMVFDMYNELYNAALMGWVPDIFVCSKQSTVYQKYGENMVLDLLLRWSDLVDRDRFSSKMSNF